MQCNFILTQLDQYLDKELSKGDLDTVEQHLGSCPSCQTEYRVAQDIITHCHNQAVPEPRPGYEHRVLQFLADETQTEKQTNVISMLLSPGFAAGFGTALATLLVVWFIAFDFAGPVDDMPILTVEIPIMQSRNVDLVFNSPRHIQNASMSIELPDGVEIVGYPNQRKLVWQTTLKQGSNRLSLPIIIKSKKGGTLLAKISHQGQSRIFKVNLLALPPSSLPGTNSKFEEIKAG